MIFYLGTHETSWLAKTDVPLFISRRRLTVRKRLPQALGAWALDSGGFTELSLFGEWRTTPERYAADIARFALEIPHLAWAAPQDWMCEPQILEKTGLRVFDHQVNTVENFLMLREALGHTVIPVLQGWTSDDYLRCWDRYEAEGVDLEREMLVGLGSVCRRQDTAEAGRIVRSLAPLKLHYFGAKLTGLQSFGDALTSADSMAWSFRARRDHPLPGCTHKSCANCLRYALRWRQRVLDLSDQLTLEDQQCVA